MKLEVSLGLMCRGLASHSGCASFKSWPAQSKRLNSLPDQISSVFTNYGMKLLVGTLSFKVLTLSYLHISGSTVGLLFIP